MESQLDISAHGISVLLLWREIHSTEESSTPAAEWRGSLYEDWWKELRTDFSFRSALSFADKENEEEQIPAGTIVHSLGYKGERFFYAYCGIVLKTPTGRLRYWSKYSSIVNCALCQQELNMHY